MLKKNKPSFVMILGLIAVQSAAAQVTVTYHAGTGTFTQTFPTGLGVSIPVVVGNQHDYVEIWCTPATADLGHITVTADVPPPPPLSNDVWILVTKDDIVQAADPQSAALAAGSWAGLTDNRGRLFLRVGISQNQTGSIFLQDNSNLVNLRVNGQIQASYTGGSTGTSEIQAGSIGSQGDITKTVGRIAVVNVFVGNMLGDIKAVTGSIGVINVTAGDIGAPGQLVAIEAAAATSGLHIDRVNTAKNMYANVDCNTSTPGVDGVIKTFFAGVGGSPTVAGDFYGLLRMDHFTEQVTVVRDFYGSIVHGGIMNPGPQATPHFNQIAIGRSFMPGAAITISPTQGLRGDIGINTLDGGYWQANATVTIGATTISQYNYSNSFSSIGGGAIGLKPYRLHDSSCMPPNGGIALSPCPNSTVEVRLRHYGPLLWTSASGLPATITRRIACTTGAFTAAPSVTTANFMLDDDNTSASEPLRTLKITYAFAAGYEYTITPTPNLKSFGGSTPEVIWESPYSVRVKSSCIADIAGVGGLPNGAVDIDDLGSV